MENDKRFWVGFNLVKGIGSARMQMLLEAFGDAESAWNASPEALQAAGLGSKVLENFLKIRSDVSLDRVWERNI